MKNQKITSENNGRVASGVIKTLGHYFLIEITKDDLEKLNARKMDVRIDFFTFNMKMEDDQDTMGPNREGNNND